MAVGVPEHEVYAAADRVLSRGERPTVERVRAELGRGSPARVGQLLETWWDALAKRLAGHAQLPALPPEVAIALLQAWEAAVAAGQAHAEAQIAPERAALVDVVTRADTAVASAQAAQAAAEAALQRVQARADGLAAQVAEQQARLADQAAQWTAGEKARAALQARLDRLEASLAASEGARETDRAAAAQERQTLLEHVRATEDRTHTEVDRVRGELKALTKERSELTQALATLEHRLHEAGLALAARNAQVRRIHAEVVRRKKSETIAVDWLRAVIKNPPPAGTASVVAEAPARRAVKATKPARTASVRR